MARTPRRHDPQRLVSSKSVRGMDVTDTHLSGTCEDCILGKMDEKPFENRQQWGSRLFRTLHTDLIGLMNPEARWTHAKFCLVVNDNCSGFAFNLKHKDEVAKILIDLDSAIETKFQRGYTPLKQTMAMSSSTMNYKNTVKTEEFQYQHL